MPAVRIKFKKHLSGRVHKICWASRQTWEAPKVRCRCFCFCLCSPAQIYLWRAWRECAARVRKQTKAGCRLCFERRSHAGRDVSPLLFIYHAMREWRWQSGQVGVLCVRSLLAPIIFKQKAPYILVRVIWFTASGSFGRPIYGFLRPKPRDARPKWKAFHVQRRSNISTPAYFYCVL